MEGKMNHVEAREWKAKVLLCVFFPPSIKKLVKQSNKCMCTHTYRLT